MIYEIRNDLTISLRLLEPELSINFGNALTPLEVPELLPVHNSRDACGGPARSGFSVDNL
jgi:hypothetical protein